MKTKLYFRIVLAAALAIGASACDENSWNNKLDGFEEFEDQPFADVQSIEYTLPEAAYAAIANLDANKALAGEEGAAALAAVATQKAFSPEAPASVYVPAFLETTGFPYFTLTEGSAVKLSYNQIREMNADVAEAIGAQTFTIPETYYIDEVWGEENYVTAFAPSKPAEDYLPSFLMDEADANDGTYAVITYALATQEPVFGGGGSQPAVPVEILNQPFNEDLGAFTINDVNLPAELSYVWSWGGPNYGAKASAYSNGTSYATESWLISPEVDLNGMGNCTLTFEHVVNKFPDAEFARANCTLWGRKVGGEWAQITIPEYTDNTSWTFGASGEISLDAYAGSKMQFAFKYVSEDGKSGTWEIKNLVLMGTPGVDNAPARAAVSVPTVKKCAVYHYNGSEWEVPSDFVVLQPADYTEMGQSYGNLPTAEPYLSTYLKVNFPYAVADDAKNVLWLHYASGAASYDCTRYVFNGTEWVAEANTEVVTEQFVRLASGWIYNPDVTINLPNGKNQELTTKYFQACVDWVFENVCKPLGDTDIKSGLFYISSYGNNEYYSGTSAYYGNVDLRPSAARAQYPAEYEAMSDEDIVALEQSRFMNEVMPGALAMLHPDAKPVEGVDTHYIINFYVYDANSATLPATAIFKVTAPGTFEPVSCTWDEE